ncbi:MAG: hypothetical protein Q9206_002168 [Seirophora lacunosa]
MDHFHPPGHTCCPETATSHPHDPIPLEPKEIPQITFPSVDNRQASQSSVDSITYTPSSTPESPLTPATEPEPQVDDLLEELKDEGTFEITPAPPRERRSSSKPITVNPEKVKNLLGEGASNASLIDKVCCGEGCCKLQALEEDPESSNHLPVLVPDNDAFRSLQLKLGPLSLESKLTKTLDLSAPVVSFAPLSNPNLPYESSVHKNPPKFVTPHPPYEVFPAKVHHARELTKPGAEKKTYHFDLDITDYPEESGTVDFVVGGAIGVCAPNDDKIVDELFDLLGVLRHLRDKPVTLKTTGGRWPTIWGDEAPRELTTTRRELLTWCSDLQSYPPTKPLLRLLAEYAEAPNEKKILMYLSSAQGQAAFCDLRTGPHLTITQLLHAFPSSKPPLPHIISLLSTLMPRFYSLSQDPLISCRRDGSQCRRIIEMAVTVHETNNWRGGPRKGVGSGFLERVAQKIMAATEQGKDPLALDLRVPMFRGLMANPLARQFCMDGPMMLIGSGVGIAPFRGFVHRRLMSENVTNKVWVVQGIRDSLLDEIYSGDWGVQEDKIKTIVQSRGGTHQYVQDAVRHQADLVWFLLNTLDGRIFVCGSQKGMGEGVEQAIIDVVIDKGNLNGEEAAAFLEGKKKEGQYIADFSFREDHSNHRFYNTNRPSIQTTPLSFHYLNCRVRTFTRTDNSALSKRYTTTMSSLGDLKYSPAGGAAPDDEDPSYYKTQYEQLEAELADFQASSRELEAELERDIEAAEKRERRLQEKIESLGYEVEEWKTKYKQSKSEANNAQSSLEKEITGLRESNRTMQLKLRDIEVANDDFEKQARNTTSSLEDLESKYNVAIERGVMFEEEIKLGENEREGLRIETQRLRDELGELRIEADIRQDKLRRAEAAVERGQRKRLADFDASLKSRPQTAMSDRSEPTTMSSPTVATPPTKSASSTVSDAPTPPSPPTSDHSVPAAPAPAIPVRKSRLSISDPSTTPRPQYSSRTPRYSRGPSATILPDHPTPSFSRRTTVNNVTNGNKALGLPKSGSLYQIRGLIGKMQNLEQRVHSARSKLPAPSSTPPRASPRNDAGTGQIPIPATITMRSNRKRTGGSMAGSIGVSTPDQRPSSRLSIGNPQPSPSREAKVNPNRPPSRASISSRTSISHLPSASSVASISRPGSRQSLTGTRTPLSHYATMSSQSESRRPRSSIGGSYANMHSNHGHGHSASVSRLSNYGASFLDEEGDSTTDALTPTPARRTNTVKEDASASGIPCATVSASKKRYSGIGSGRRMSSGPGEMGPPDRRGTRKLSGVGEAF